MLLTAGDVHRRQSYVNARRTLETLLRWGMVPVVNENDSTATDEITFGDNDALAAQVALILNARLLVLLTDADGLYDRDPRQPGATLIPEVRDHRLLADLEVGGPSGAWGSGGMRSKVVAAEMASAGGIGTVIACGARDGAVLEAAAGRPVGTRFVADRRPLPAYKLWLRYGKPVRGAADGRRRRPRGRLSTMAPACSRSGCAMWVDRSRQATASSSRGPTGRRSRAASAPIRRPSCAAWSGARGSMRRCTEITLCCCERSHTRHRHHRRPPSRP